MTDYRMIAKQVRSLAEEDACWLPLCSNACAILYQEMPEVNWVGFYLTRTIAGSGRTLVVGPFQGKPACVHIPFGRGVCGTAALEDRAVVVDDVHEFPGHIACDCATNSEIVIPLHAGGRVVGVLDIDSTTLRRFSPDDLDGLRLVASTIEEVATPDGLLG